MKFSLKFIGIAVGILLLGSGSAWGETLQGAVKHMLQTNPEIKAASYNRLARDQEVIQAQGGYYPTLDAYHSSGIDYQKDYLISGTEKTRPKSTAISLRQNLFQFGVTDSEVSRLEARVRSQAYLLQGTSENLSLQASRVYLNVLRNLELHELAKENLLNHERIHDQMKLRSTSGVDRTADLDQVSGRLALAQSNMVVTQTNIEDAKTDYLALIGRLPEDLTKPSPVDADIPVSMEEAERLALKNYPIIKSAQADLEAREAQYEVARRINYPKLDAAVDYKWETDVQYPHRTEDFIATAIVSFNIFNGFRNKARIEETLQAVNEAKEILNNTKRQSVQSVRLSWEAYKTANDRVTYLEEYVKATGLTTEAFGKQWTIGRRTMFDVLDTQAEYINAKSDLVRAKFDKMYAEYRVLSGIGNMVKALRLQWPAETRLDYSK
jgi:adhesin transport system outer membrane protein